MSLADIHCHILYGLDDGAENKEQMFDMLDSAYNAGIRLLCATPHHNPDYFPYFPEKEAAAFETLSRYAGEKYPDMILSRGNEVFVYSDVPSIVKESYSCLLSEKGHVLIEFSPLRSFKSIDLTVNKLTHMGFIPVMAHIERYSALDMKKIEGLRDMGAVITVNSGSICGNNGKKAMRLVHKLIKRGLVDIVASDAHSSHAYMGFSVAYQKVREEYGEHAADKLFAVNASRLLGFSFHRVPHEES